jgi:hypothetical protein
MDWHAARTQEMEKYTNFSKKNLKEETTSEA